MKPFCLRYGMLYLETSALTGHGITAGIEKLLQMVMVRVEKSVEEDFLPAK